MTSLKGFYPNSFIEYFINCEDPEELIELNTMQDNRFKTPELPTQMFTLYCDSNQRIALDYQQNGSHYNYIRSSKYNVFIVIIKTEYHYIVKRSAFGKELIYNGTEF